MDYQVIIVGGGIHGVGVLHDLASRGVNGVHLVERKHLASGTSSRSSKLLHGGIRYLEHLGQWPLVREALKERTVLMGLLKEIVRPLPFVLPCPPGGYPPWMIRLGLFFYDNLAGHTNLPRARKLKADEIEELVPYLPKEKITRDFKSAFLYYDGQMRDDVIVRLVAHAASKLGASFEEHTEAVSITPIASGFRVELRNAAGTRTVTTRKVVNAGGYWVTANLLRWGFQPSIISLMNVGSHLVFKAEAIQGNPATAAATLFQNDDGRAVFFLPWFDRWLFGTTESILKDSPAALSPPQQDKKYLLQVAEKYMNRFDLEPHIEEVFAGIRMMPIRQASAELGPIESKWREQPFSSPFYLRNSNENISALSRETIIDDHIPNLLSVYGGKFTTYRAESEKIGNRISRELGWSGRSKTSSGESWFLHEILSEHSDLFLSDRTLRQVGG